VLGIQPFPVRIEVIAWLAYLVPMIAIVAWPARRRPRAAASAAHPATAQPAPAQQQPAGQ
jgi:high-affinity iron transporter